MKSIQALKMTDRMPYTPPIMSADDEIARLKSILANTKVLNSDLTKIIAQKDKYRAALLSIIKNTTDKGASDLAAEALQPK